MKKGIIMAGAAIAINWIVAGKMADAAYRKGYDSSIHAFAMCFWLGVIGYLYVIALPDLVARKNQETMIALLNKKEDGNTVGVVFANEELPPL